MTVKGVLKGSGVVSVLVKQTPYEGRAHPSQNSEYNNVLKVHKTNSAPFLNCPRYSKCSSNNCPLDPVYPAGFVHPDDIEQKCTLPKSYRVKVAAEFPGVLKFGGLKHKEFNGKKVWESKTPEEQGKTTAQLKKNGFASVSQKDIPKAGMFVPEERETSEKYEFWGV